MCAAAFAEKEIKHFWTAAFTLMLSVLLTFVMRSLNLIPLLFPFVFAVWIGMVVEKIFEKKR